MRKDDDVQPAGTARPNLALPPPRDAVFLVVGLLGVSLSGPLIAATVAPALAIAFWRNALGTAVTGSVMLLRNRAELRRISRRELGLSGLAGVFLAAHFATWIPSLTMTTVATSTALVATQPVFVATLAHLQGTFLPRRAWWAIGLAVVAAALITGADVSLSGRAVLGDLLAVLGGACAALYVTAGAKARTTMSASVYTTLCYGVCAVVLLIACVIGRQHVIGFSGNAWLKVVAITVVAQLLGHTLFNLVLRSTSPTVISIALLLEVPGAALVAFVWLHQHPPATAWPGLVLLLVALVGVVSARGTELPVEATE